MKSKKKFKLFNFKKKSNKLIFRVPFAFGSLDKLKKRSGFFKRFVGYKNKSKIGDSLKNADADATREEYLAVCTSGFFISFIILFVLSSTALILLGINNAFLFSFGLSFLFGFFVFFSRAVYPSVYNSRKQKEIEKNLIPALQDMLVQLNAGVPLFTIMINISAADYSELSQEFKKAVKEINAGMPQIDVLENLGKRNPSEFFRRALWQISNGMRAGSDISIVIEDTVHSLGEEQFIQIQHYGNKLNPAIMFYMLSSVILPALAITFLTIISSLINLPSLITKVMFLALFAAVVIIQILFLGVVKSIRPSLL
ncbi:MAG: type II secretion system F family protein [Nanoarchaeota archaeon]|nr:type II secretion system F family protein [Nanoarchaeota archaeon]MBU1103575.1 type II secretion system F family protein [Nanoarchaeota archaeon]